MKIEQYKSLINEVHFNEYPYIFTPEKDYLSQIVNYHEADIDLKIYLVQLILCRSFYGTYTSWYADVKWFISSFFSEFEKDCIKPHLSETIKCAVEMIMSGETFTKKIIGTTFMFGVLEFYAKYKLGFRPLSYNFFDKRKKEYIKQLNPALKQNELSIKSAFEYLQKQQMPIANALNNIDNFTTQRLSDVGIESAGWTPHKIADRLSLARNPMLHGEAHNFFNQGEYLLLLYILFHLFEIKENTLTYTN